MTKQSDRGEGPQGVPTFGAVLETGLDFTTSSFSPEEKDTLLQWYRERHGVPEMELNKFAEHLIDHYPTGLKRFRRFAMENSTPDENGVALPGGAYILLYLHLYTTQHNERGILYELVACKSNGVRKAEALDTLRFAFLSAGPMGMNAVAELSKDYLENWEDLPGTAGISWAPEWSTGRDFASIGLDVVNTDFLEGESERVIDWYRRTSGGAPNHAELLARIHPRGYKTMLMRRENVFDALPVQMAPLFVLCEATANVWPSVIRRAVLQARSLGVRRHEVVQTIFIGALNGGEWKLEAAIEPIADILEKW
jgi:hypothetical protein